MARYVAVKANTNFRSETFGNPLSASTGHFIDQVSEDISMDRGLIFPETSAQRVMRNRIPGQVAISGDIQVPLYSKGTPTLLYYALGEDTYDDNVRSVNGLHKHTLTAAPVPKTFQMGVGKDIKEHRYMGCVVKSFTIDYDPSETVLTTFSTMSRIEVAAGDIIANPVFPDYNVLERAIGGVEVNTKIGVNGAATEGVDSLESASIEVDNGYVDDNYVIGSRYIPEAYVQNHTVSGSLEFGYDSYDRYAAVNNEDEWKVELIGPDLKSGLARGSGANSTAVRQVQVTLPQIALLNVNLPTEGTDRYILSVDYQGERQTGSDDLIVVDVTNQETKAELTL